MCSRILLGALLTAWLCPPAHAAQPDIQVCFVPGPQDCASVAADAIADARRSVDVQAYSFTEPQIAQALLDAHERGVTVRLVADKSAPRERNGKTEVLAMAGVPVWVDYIPHIAHNKVIVIDGATVLTGSFNWTTSADRHNAENLLMIHDTDLAGKYEQNFEDRLLVSESLNDYEAEHPPRVRQ